MKIGYVIQQAPELRHPPFDGPSEHIRKVAAALQQLGHPIRMVFGRGGAIWSTDELRAFRPVVVPSMSRGAGRWIERWVRRTQRSLRLPYLNLFESRRFGLACVGELKGSDLVYERLSWTGYGGSWAAGKLRRPHLLEYNGDPYLDLEAKQIAPHGLQRRGACWGMRRVLTSADHIVASGEGWRQQLIDTWGVAPRRVTVIENGTALLGLLERSRLRSFRPETQPVGPLDMVYLGGFLPWHGISQLIKAAALASKGGLSLRLRLIGSGPGWEDARRLSREQGLEEQVRFLGNLPPEQFAPLLAESDIAMSPYCGWREYSGLKILDYKAAGLAIVASGIGGQPATLEHGRTGWIVPPCDIPALTQAIQTLAANPGLRRSLGQAARLEAESRHGWDVTARSLERLFDQVLTSGASDGA